MDEQKAKEVLFVDYCQTCKYKDDPETDDMCNECLSEPGRQYTHKPLNYKEK